MVNESSNPSKNIPKIAEKVTKNDSDIEIIDDLNIKVDKEAQKKDIFICNCKKEDQHIIVRNVMKVFADFVLKLIEDF